MRVAIDATDAFASRRTGTGVYVRSLCEEMMKISGRDELTLLGLRSLAADVGFVDPGTLRLLSSPQLRTLWSQCRIPAHLAVQKYDLVHFVDHKLPFLFRGKSIVTIHDAAFLRFPETFRTGHRQRLEWFTRDAVRRAVHIIAVSGSTRDDLCRFYSVDPRKVSVVHHAVNPLRYHGHVTPLRRENPYILAVGALHPRKNYEMLIRAFRKVCARLDEKVELLIVGQRAWLWEGVEREAALPPFNDRIRLVGYVADEELPSYYAGARVFVLPSLYEGFGIPILEAMACGTPVVASSVSSMPEVVGDAGLLLDPADEQSWVDTLVQLWESEPHRRRLIERGLFRATEFSWTQAATRTLELYRSVVAGV